LKKKNLIGNLVNALKKDFQYYDGWKANIAMAVYDEFVRAKVKVTGGKTKIHELCNNGADAFLMRLIK
jgi:hypothetical protein